MERQAKFESQLDAVVRNLKDGPVPLPDHLLKQVSGGMMVKPPFCQFLQYEAFRQIGA